ncbi:MAG TPA: DNA translocase FtsK 4TM domain-containing protein, partial [Brevundimonas sp.]|nr:DNA translocase FtsK 4TM domain-containing protein [Brevundimonas sp.]
MSALALGHRAFESARILWAAPFVVRVRGVLQALLAALLLAALISWNPADPSLNAASSALPTNWLGLNGALFADLFMQSLGLAAWPAALLLIAFGLAGAIGDAMQQRLKPTTPKALSATAGVLALSAGLSALAAPAAWPLAAGLGGLWGDALVGLVRMAFSALRLPGAAIGAGVLFFPLALWGIGYAIGLRFSDLGEAVEWARGGRSSAPPAPAAGRARAAKAPPRPRPAPEPDDYPPVSLDADAGPPWQEPVPARGAPEPKVAAAKAPKASRREIDDSQAAFDSARPSTGFDLPPLGMLTKPVKRVASVDEEALKQNAKMLEGVLQEFGVRGAIDQIRPGPVVTLYELVPAPGVKHGRVVALSDDIARSMSARACRISVVPGRNAIGIELPNAKRETVYLRDLLASTEYDKPAHLLPLALGETIGGEPYVADLARMPHLLIAGTTGSGKSVGVNAMILSILYRHSPAECRFIMIDPKMLELSVYDGIPHLLAPVVTDPKKAVVALKWTVREMEDRYRRMSKLGVRNIASYNERAREAQAKGEHFERTVQTGFD